MATELLLKSGECGRGVSNLRLGAHPILRPYILRQPTVLPRGISALPHPGDYCCFLSSSIRSATPAVSCSRFFLYSSRYSIFSSRVKYLLPCPQQDSIRFTSIQFRGIEDSDLAVAAEDQVLLVSRPSPYPVRSSKPSSRSLLVLSRLW